MSLWYDIPTEDLSLDEKEEQVDILVTNDDSGNIYATLTYNQIKELYDKIFGEG